MKIFKLDNYINEKLTIQPVSKDRLAYYKKPSVDEITRKFIEDNNLIWNPLSKCYDCGGDVTVSEDIVIDGKLKIRFGKVGGAFDCSDCGLKSLEGAPLEVDCIFCVNNDLCTLEGCPQMIWGDAIIESSGLVSLKGAPIKVYGNFSCHSNALESLEGSPKEVEGFFDCSANCLNTLKGAPQKIKSNFVCIGNEYDEPLTFDDTKFIKVGGNFYYKDTDIEIPDKKPKWLKGKFIDGDIH